MKKKNLFLFIILCCVGLFSSCSSDNNEPEAPKYSIAGTWTSTSVVLDNNGIATSSPIHMVWDAPDGTMMGILKVSDLPNIACGIGGSVLNQVLRDITFNEDGSISATYSDAGIGLDLENPITPNWKNSGTGYITYTVISDTQLTLKLEVDKIGQTDPDFAEMLAENPQFKTLLSTPFVFNYKKDGSKIVIYIDKTFMDTVVVPLIPKLLPLIDDEELNGMGAMIKGMLTALPEALKVTTKFEIGLNLTK